MVESIQTTKVARTYFENSRYDCSEVAGYGSAVRDSVRFSKKALEKLKELAREQQSPRGKPAADYGIKQQPSIFEIEGDATPDQIRSAYRHAIKQYHPDRYATSPPEFRKLAEEKTKEINRVYNRLKKFL